MRAMPTIDVVSDASVVLGWFHDEGEEEVSDSRAILRAHRERAIAMVVLDLTVYEVGNALLRGRVQASAEQTATVLEALSQICPAVSPDADDLRLGVELAERYDLTLYDAAYAAVAQRRGGLLATLDRKLLAAGLGSRPSEIVAQLLG